MELKDLYSLDIRLKLQAGLPIEVPEVGELKPKTLKEISQVGYSKFTHWLNALTMDVAQTLPEQERVVNGVRISSFDVFMHTNDEEFVAVFLDALKYFFNEEKILHTQLPVNESAMVDIIVLGITEREEILTTQPLRMIHRMNFGLISELLKIQNGLKSHKIETKFNVKKSKAQEIAERLRRGSEMVSKLKKNSSKTKVQEEIDISDIISAVSTKSNTISKLNVWELTLYQLYEEYKRLHAINQYEVNIQALMNGAEGIELRDWSAKLDE